MISCGCNHETRRLVLVLAAVLAWPAAGRSAVIEAFEWKAAGTNSWQTEVLQTGCTGSTLTAGQDPLEGHFIAVSVPAGQRCAAVAGFNESSDTLHCDRPDGHFVSARIRVRKASGLDSSGKTDPMRGGVALWLLSDDRGGDRREPALMITQTGIYRLLRREATDTFAAEQIPAPAGFDPAAGFHEYALQFNASSGEYEYVLDGIRLASHARGEAPPTTYPSGLRIGNPISGRSTAVAYDLSRISFGGGGVQIDACDGLITHLQDGTVTGTTVGATRDGTASCGGPGNSPDVWYAYTPASDGTLSLSTCGSEFDTILSVRTDCDAAELACNDECGGPACGAPASCLELPVVKAKTYRIRISGANGSAGNYRLTALGPPSNGDCAGAQALTAGQTQGRTLHAAGGGHASCGDSDNSPDVWYRYTATGSGELRLDACEADFETVLSVHRGDCGAAGEVACSAACEGEPCTGSRACIRAAVEQGESYLVRVTGRGGKAGRFTLQVDDSRLVSSLPIGSERQLFTDSYVVEHLDGARLKLHPPRPAGTALRLDKPWEGRFAFYTTVLKDQGTYRMYYRGWPEGASNASAVTCYAESPDGINWTRPDLRLHEVSGSRENNVILGPHTPGDVTHNFCPFVDDRPGVPPEQRLKALGGESAGLIPYASADGIHWSAMQAAPVVTGGAFDSQNVAFWSTSENCYVCYYRTWSGGFRRISRQVSSDFLHWTGAVEMGYGGAPIEHLYVNQTAPYFRAPQIYIALPARFMAGRRVLTDDQCAALNVGAAGGGCVGVSETVLMTTRGGDQYDRTFMDGFVRPGLGYSNWVARTNYAALGVVPTGPGEMSIYVNRDYGQLTAYVERMTLRTDGFASVYAGLEGGEMLSRPMRFSGNELLVNYATSVAGEIRVEIQDLAGKPLPGFALADADPLIGDEIDRAVSWKGRRDVGTLAGEAVRLRLVMKAADLYAFQFR